MINMTNGNISYGKFEILKNLTGNIYNNELGKPYELCGNSKIKNTFSVEINKSENIDGLYFYGFSKGEDK